MVSWLWLHWAAGPGKTSDTGGLGAGHPGLPHHLDQDEVPGIIDYHRDSIAIQFSICRRGNVAEWKTWDEDLKNIYCILIISHYSNLTFCNYSRFLTSIYSKFQTQVTIHYLGQKFYFWKITLLKVLILSMNWREPNRKSLVNFS